MPIAFPRWAYWLQRSRIIDGKPRNHTNNGRPKGKNTERTEEASRMANFSAPRRCRLGAVQAECEKDLQRSDYLSRWRRGFPDAKSIRKMTWQLWEFWQTTKVSSLDYEITFATLNMIQQSFLTFELPSSNELTSEWNSSISTFILPSIFSGFPRSELWRVQASYQTIL